jgi:hypothetical protein
MLNIFIIKLNYPPLREAKASLEVGDSFLIVLRLLKEEFGF